MRNFLDRALGSYQFKVVSEASWAAALSAATYVVAVGAEPSMDSGAAILSLVAGCGRAAVAGFGGFLVRRFASVN